MRNRLKFLDGAAVVFVTLVALFYAYEVDVFVTSDKDLHEKTIDLDEALAVSTLFAGGMTLFAFRRWKEARHETERRLAAEREAKTMAFHDSLTGLPNRRHFDEALKAAVAAPPRLDASHAVILIDLNGFKRVNDIHGHRAGDELLMQVGARLGRAVPDGDLVARLGGDEFGILALHIAGAEAATGLCIRLMDALVPPISAANSDHQIGAAIGVSLTPQDGLDPDELLRRADVALYRAKADKAEASSMRFFEDAMDVHLRERDALERDLRQAIAEGAIRSFYQPMVDLKTGSVTAFEALARWRSTTLGDVPPGRFVTVAEDTGLIAPLTDLLLAQACRDAVQWPRSITLCFNVSAVLLRDRTFGLRVLNVLNQSGLPASRLELEITESALVRDLDAAATALGELRDLGVRIALDDFGTGYSSLYHLRKFKVDKIKIDRSFIAAMEEDGDSRAIVGALVGLGQGLGLRVTAEGIETGAQERLLAEQGCDEGQGFHFAAALDASAAAALASEKAPADRTYAA